jgi:phage-related protein
MPGCGNGIGSGGKGRLDRVTDGLEQLAAVGLDRYAQKVKVTFDGRRHRHTVPLPARYCP